MAKQCVDCSSLWLFLSRLRRQLLDCAMTACIYNAGEEEEEMAEDEVAAEAKGDDAAAGEVEETG